MITGLIKFKNREDAGRQLAERLKKYAKEEAIIYALPRGGVVLGFEIAQALLLPLDIVITRKIGHPSNAEYAIGAVDEDGTLVLNEAEAISVNQQWLEKEIEKQKGEARRRGILYRKGKQRPDIVGRVAIIVDDGIATGFTMRLAVKVIKSQHPEKIIIAVPVASSESIHELKKEGIDEVIVLEPPEEFLGTVGAYYQEFSQVSDEEVIKLLESTNKTENGK